MVGEECLLRMPKRRVARKVFLATEYNPWPLDTIRHHSIDVTATGRHCIIGLKKDAWIVILLTAMTTTVRKDYLNWGEMQSPRFRKGTWHSLVFSWEPRR